MSESSASLGSRSCTSSTSSRTSSSSTSSSGSSTVNSSCRSNSSSSSSSSSFEYFVGQRVQVSSDVAEHCGRYVLDELLATERQYVEDLYNDMARYMRIFEQPDDSLPDGLAGQQHVLLANVSQIASLHRYKLLPLMLQHRQQVKQLFDGWLSLLERGCFYCYVLFAANQRASQRLYNDHEGYFKHLQITIGDPLGLRSFLLKPVQRIARYPLLLSNLIRKFYENRAVIPKKIIEQACRLEQRLRQLLVRANQADQLNDIKHFNAFNVLNEAKFITVGEFHLIDSKLRRTFKCKLYAFNTCLIYTERKGKKQSLRGNFMLPDVCFVPKSKKSFLLCNKQRECEFYCRPHQLEKWEQIVKQLLQEYGERYNIAGGAGDATVPNGEGEAGEGSTMSAASAAINDAESSRTTWY